MVSTVTGVISDVPSSPYARRHARRPSTLAAGVRKAGGEIENVYSRALTGFAARMTADQANVYFKSMLLYSVQNADEETIKKVAFTSSFFKVSSIAKISSAPQAESMEGYLLFGNKIKSSGGC
jgi:hypothetical protein